MKLGETESSFNEKKTEFEKLRSDVQIKLKFLDQNRVGSLAPFMFNTHKTIPNTQNSVISPKYPNCPPMCEYNTLLMNCSINMPSYIIFCKLYNLGI